MMSIRTYIKKKDPISIDSVIQNYHELCRLCLQKSDDFINIFDADGFCSLPLRILTCLGIDVKDDKWLPKTLCASCHRELTNCYKFRKKCLSVNIQLQKHLKALRMCFRKAYIDQKNANQDDVCVVNKTDTEKLLEAASTCFKKELISKTLPNSTVTSVNQVIQREDRMKLDIPMNVTLPYMKSIINAPDKISMKESPLKQNVTLDISKHIKFSLSSNSLEKSLGMIPQNTYEIPTHTSCNTIIPDYQLMVSSPVDVTPTSKVIEIIEPNIHSDSIERIHLIGPNLINPEVSNSVERNTANLNCSEKSPVAEKEPTYLPTNCLSVNTDTKNNASKLKQVPTEADYNQTEQNERQVIRLSSLMKTALHVSGRLGRSFTGPEYVEVMTKDGNMVTMEICEEADSNASIQHGLVVSLPMADGKSICSADLAKRGSRRLVRAYEAAQASASPSSGPPAPVQSRAAAAAAAAAAAGLRCPHEGCGRVFAQREVLRRHMLLHEEVRPFVCAWCGRGYTQEAALRAHERSHAPPPTRPITLYDCPLCPKKFCYQSGLSRHVLSHKGSKFMCQKCSKMFDSPYALRRHLASPRRLCAKLPMHAHVAVETDTTVR